MLWHIQRVYIDYAILAVRRQAKRGDDSVYLRGVMEGVRDAAKTLTRHWHQRLWRGETKSKYALAGIGGPFVEWRADEVFSEFADAGGERVDASIVEHDLEEFIGKTSAIVDLADKAVAHDDKRGFKAELYAKEDLDLDAAVLAVEHCTRRYGRLLFGLVPGDMTPVAVRAVLDAFRIPWLTTQDEETISKEFNLWSGRN
jgi:hypothetical protein